MTPVSIATEPSSPARIARFSRLASFPAAMAALLIMLAVLTVRGRFDDPDMWWHLKTGQIIATTHHIPTTDLYSYTTNHHSYIPHEWLSQLVIYSCYAAHGLSGLMFYESALTAVILLASFYFCTVYSGNYRLSFLATLLVWFFGTIGFAVRPHMIGYVLLIAELLFLHLGHTRDARWFLTLPPLFAVWVNSHGSFSLGIVAATAYFVSSFFAFDTGALIASAWAAKSRRMLGLSLVVSVFALLLNPDGIQLVLYPLKTMYVPSVSIDAVSEWQPLAFDQARAFGLLAVLIVLALLVGASRAKLYLHEVFLAGATTWLALNHRRLLFPFGIVIAPILARILAQAWRDNTTEQQHPAANTSLIAVALAISYASFPSPAALHSQVRGSSPVAAVDYIKSHHLAGPMMNEWGDGGYLIWALPDHPVFIDGRADVYDWAGVTPEVARWATLAETPNILLDKYNVQFCLLRTKSPMNTAVSLLPNWRRIYSDDLSVIYQRIR